MSPKWTVRCSNATETAGLRRDDWGRILQIRPTLLLSLLLLAACVQPGRRAEGAGRASWGGESPVQLTGRCAYNVSSRWAAPYNHVIEFTAVGRNERITVSTRRRWQSGSLPLEIEGEDRAVVGTVWSGNTVAGSVRGEIRIDQTGDSLVVAIRGERLRRDTVPLVADCRMGPIEG